MPAPHQQRPPTTNPAQQALAGRVRTALPTGRTVREVAMFGGRAFMLDEAMLVSVGKDGDMLVRIDPARHDELTNLPGARHALMGVDRRMGPGWIAVDTSGLDTDVQLAFWLELALQHHSKAS